MGSMGKPEIAGHMVTRKEEDYEAHTRCTKCHAKK